MTTSCDVAIVGSGFGGSILAMVARRIGLRVLLIERGRHPRFAIGESSSPLAGILIEQLAERYDLPRLAPLAAYGSWRRAYPELTCGLKRGFTFFAHDAGRRYAAAPDRSNQLLVAASPCDELADTHWLRADVDEWLVEEARALGVEYVDDADVRSVEDDGDAMVLELHRDGAFHRVRARGVVDASGPRGFGHRHLGVTDRGFDHYPATAALFTHFTGVDRCNSRPEFRVASGPLSGAMPPYPPDDAAVHHVFEGGWVWVLRFDTGVTSAGIVATSPLADELRLDEGLPAWTRVLARVPSLAALFAAASPVRPFVHVPRVAYRASAAVGPRWAALPSAAAFVDPLFSTGFPLTLLGVERLGRLFERGLFQASSGDGVADDLAAYQRTTFAEADQAAAFIAGCFAAFSDFPRFADHSMFYFAAASFAEAHRRLNATDDRQVMTPSFLGLNAPEFSESLRRLSPASDDSAPDRGHGGGDADAIRRAIEPLNVAGLCEPRKANWYDVDDADLVAGAGKLGVTPEAVRRLLATVYLRAGRPRHL